MENSELMVIDKVNQGGLKMEYLENPEGRQFLSVNGCEPVELNTHRIDQFHGFMQDIWSEFIDGKVKIDDVSLDLPKNVVTNSRLNEIVKEEATKLLEELKNK